MASSEAKQDVLYGFDWYGRSEPIRMMYHMKGEKFEDHRIGFMDWRPKYKDDMPLGALPVLKTADGTINQSKAIARYVAKRFGFMGSTLWEETLHDVVLENMSDAADYVSSIFFHKVENGPPPKKSYEETRQFCLQVLRLLEKTAGERGKKFIIGDEIGLGDIWLYTTLGYWLMVIPEILQDSKWVADFKERFESLDKVKKYLDDRPPDTMPAEVIEKLRQKATDAEKQ